MSCCVQTIVVVDILNICCISANSGEPELYFPHCCNPICMRSEYNSGCVPRFEPITSGCACPGDSMTFECNNIGIGTTVFRGSAFDCESSGNTISLLHSRFHSPNGTNGTCNNGAIVGQSLNVEGNCYTSQLHVTISLDLLGKTIECVHDNGTLTEVVGRYLIPTANTTTCLLYTSPSPRDATLSRMPSSA